MMSPTSTMPTGAGASPPAGGARVGSARPRVPRVNSVPFLVFARDQGIFVLFVVLIAVFAVWAGSLFASFDNAMLILQAAAVTAVIASGVAVGAMSGALDLSVPGTAALGAVLMAKVITGGGPVWLGILVAILLGIAVGVVNGVITLRGLNPLVVTIGTLSILSGASAVIAKGEPIPGLDDLAFIGTDHVWKIPSSAFLIAGLYLIATVFLTRTRGGVRMLAVGGNAEAARRAGVPADRYRVLGFVVTGICSAIGGVLIAATTTQASPVASTGILFDALTAVALAGVSLAGGRGSLPKVLVGALIIAMINNALVIKNVQPFWAQVATGVLLIGALMLDKLLGAAVADRLVALGGSSAHVPASAPEEK
jgi:ribose transport system permease protein